MPSNLRTSCRERQGNQSRLQTDCQVSYTACHCVRHQHVTSSRALARMGNVYLKQEKWKEAIRYYDKSLAEHRFPDTLAKKNEVLMCA